jgi:superoxide reductase
MLEIMKCSLCGKMIMIIRTGGRRTICCDKPMEKMTEQGREVGKEMHVPVVEKTENGVRVRVGAVPNPMRVDHYIEWIEVADGPYLQVKGLRPGDPPVAEFTGTSPKVKARVYCEEHGLWSNRPSRSKG